MIFKPPTQIDKKKLEKETSVFLAGSIEQGTASDWAKRITKLFEGEFDIFNPRRDKWDADLKQDISNKTFVEQVNWELDALDAADLIFMYFEPETKSPISLLELGLYAASGKLTVVCPDGFWRKGNVQIVCDRFDITLHESLDDFEKWFKRTTNESRRKQ
jgi:hypothetical protein